MHTKKMEEYIPQRTRMSTSSVTLSVAKNLLSGELVNPQATVQVGCQRLRVHEFENGTLRCAQGDKKCHRHQTVLTVAAGQSPPLTNGNDGKFRDRSPLPNGDNGRTPSSNGKNSQHCEQTTVTKR